MTLPPTTDKPKRRQRAPEGCGLFVTDVELCELLGVPEYEARPTIASLDKNPIYKFPPKQKLWGDRRYFPAVRDWLDRHNGIIPRIDAARVAPERPVRTGLPRRTPAEPLRRASNDRPS